MFSSRDGNSSTLSHFYERENFCGKKVIQHLLTMMKLLKKWVLYWFLTLVNTHRCASLRACDRIGRLQSDNYLMFQIGNPIQKHSDPMTSEEIQRHHSIKYSFHFPVDCINIKCKLRQKSTSNNFWRRNHQTRNL